MVTQQVLEGTKLLYLKTQSRYFPFVQTVKLQFAKKGVEKNGFCCLAIFGKSENEYYLNLQNLFRPFSSRGYTK